MGHHIDVGEKQASISLDVVRGCSWTRGHYLSCSRFGVDIAVVWENSVLTIVFFSSGGAGCPHRDEIPRDALRGDACRRGVGLPMGRKHDRAANAWSRGEEGGGNLLLCGDNSASFTSGL